MANGNGNRNGNVPLAQADQNSRSFCASLQIILDVHDGHILAKAFRANAQGETKTKPIHMHAYMHKYVHKYLFCSSFVFKSFKSDSGPFLPFCH